MKKPFEDIVSAIGYSMIAGHGLDEDSDDDFSNNRLVRFLIDQHGRMPDYLRLPFACVTLAFDWSSVLRHGTRFHRLPHAPRWRQIEAWRAAPLGVCRDFVKFFEALTIFYWKSKVAAGSAAGETQARSKLGRTAA